MIYLFPARRQGKFPAKEKREAYFYLFSNVPLPSSPTWPKTLWHSTVIHPFFQTFCISSSLCNNFWIIEKGFPFSNFLIYACCPGIIIVLIYAQLHHGLDGNNWSPSLILTTSTYPTLSSTLLLFILWTSCSFVIFHAFWIIKWLYSLTWHMLHLPISASSLLPKLFWFYHLSQGSMLKGFLAFIATIDLQLLAWLSHWCWL